MNENQKTEILSKIDTIKSRVAEYGSEVDGGFIDAAYEIAERCYGNEETPDNRLLLDHCVEAALALTKYNLDGETIAAALLHDAVRLGTSEKEISETLSPIVGETASLINQLGVMRFSLNELQEKQHLRQMFVAMAGNVRVVMIELAGRLIFMRNSDNIPEDLVEDYAQETLDVYAPLAHRLGVAKLKSELEDLCFRVLYPVEFRQLKRLAGETEAKRREAIDKVIETMKKFFDEDNIKVNISGRTKRLYSTYCKMLRQSKDFNELFDLAAVRVITDTEEDCYLALSKLHSTWTPVHEEFDDYIATPKDNGYKSIHTVVIAPNKQPVEVQIRTWEMHMTSEFGVASHWQYKETVGGGKSDDYGLVTWLKDLSDSDDKEKITDTRALLQNAVLDTSKGKVFVMTPRGKVVRLPRGATPIDFAYRIHTEVGHRCRGARINGQIVPLDYNLHNGDVIEIITKKQGAPSRDWLRVAVSSQARSRIRSWFRKADRTENVTHGRNMLQRELSRHGLKRKDLIERIDLSDILKSYNFKIEEDLHAALGCGDVTIEGVIERIRRAYRELLEKEEVEKTISSATTTPKRRHKRRKKKQQQVVADGFPGIMVVFAKCCLPIPHDEIVGFVTNSRGISIHRKICPNVKNYMNSGDRVVDVKWSDSEDNVYLSDILVNCLDRVGILNEVLAIISEAKVNIDTLKTKSLANSTSLISIRLEAQDIEKVDFILSRINGLRDVLSAGRRI